MLIFFVINMTFMNLELGYGVYSNSLGLISDAFHMLSDCFSILIALVASYISSGHADKIYTYGYERIEVLAGLFNCLFLVFVAYNVFCESFKRLFQPEYIEGENLLLISVLGLIVNIIGLIFFHEHAHIGHSKAHNDSCKHNKLEKLDSTDSEKGLIKDEESPSPRAVI